MNNSRIINWTSAAPKASILVYALLLIIAFILLLPVNMGGDDLFFADFATGNSFDFATYRFFYGTSRVIIEFFLALFSKHFLCGKLLTSIFYVIIAICLNRMIFNKIDFSNSVSCCLLVLCYSFKDMLSAGPVATSLNYFGILGFLLIAMLPFFDYIHKRKTSLTTKIVSIFASVLACNQEQAVCILLAVIVIYLCLLIKNKECDWCIFVLLFVCVANIILILMCPGNAVRKTQEITTWFPDFDSLSIVNKYLLWSMSTFSILVKSNGLLVVLAFSFIAMSFTTNGFKLNKRVSICFLIVSIVLQILVVYCRLYCPNRAIIAASTPEFINIMRSADWSLSLYGKTIVCEHCYIALLLVGILSFSKKYSSLLLALFTLGFGSRFIMILSPTINESGNRTAIFLIFSLLVIVGMSLCVIQDSKLNSSKKQKCFGAFNALLLFNAVFASIMTLQASITL